MSPSEIVEWAAKSGLEAISVTDHDTVAGLEEAREAAKSRGISFVDGIEISAFSVSEIHILGYNIDPENADFLYALENVKRLRKDRNIKIGEKLRSFGVALDLDFEADGIGRMNIARELVAEGYACNVNAAFEKYLSNGDKAYCQTERISPLEAVKLINLCGGIACVAHPKKYLLDGRLDMLLSGLSKFGLKGLEVYYPNHGSKEIGALLQLCEKYRLTATGGSDFHGEEDRNFVAELPLKTLKALKIV